MEKKLFFNKKKWGVNVYEKKMWFFFYTLHAFHVKKKVTVILLEMNEYNQFFQFKTFLKDMDGP